MSSEFCNFEPTGSVFKCSRCGVRRRVAVLRKCNDAPKAGDALEELLTSHGITKEWWSQYKAEHGLPPTCGCDKRREYLNELSKAHPNLAKYGVMVFRALTRKPQ